MPRTLAFEVGKHLGRDHAMASPDGGAPASPSFADPVDQFVAENGLPCRRMLVFSM
jgi:hypothetical protein